MTYTKAEPIKRYCKSKQVMCEDLISRAEAIEAIEIVDWYHQNQNKDMVHGANDDEHQAWYKAQDIYKALEAVPSANRPKDGDLISRAEAIEAMGEEPPVWCDEEADMLAFEAEIDYCDTFTSDDFIDDAKCYFKDIPSADVTPVRHGHWVESFKVNAPPTLKSRWICSWCGNVQTYGATDYCPNCGAEMRTTKGEK